MPPHDVRATGREADGGVPVRVTQTAAPTEPRKLLEGAVRLAARGCDAAAAFVVAREGDERRVVARVGIDLASAERALDSALLAPGRREATLVRDAAADPALVGDPLVAQRHRLVVCEPVLDAAGSTAGTLVVLDVRPRDETFDVELVRLAATQAGAHLEALRRPSTSQGVPPLLLEASRRLASLSTEEELGAALVDLTVPRLADACVVDLVDGDAPRRVAAAPASGGSAFANAALAVLGQPTAPIGTEGAPQRVSVEDDEAMARVVPDAARRAALRAAGVRDLLVVPLRARGGEASGRMTLLTAGPEPRRFSADDAALAEELAHRAAMVLETARVETRARKANERTLALVDDVEAIFWEADASSFEFSFVSPRAEAILGYPTSAWTEISTFWADHIHPLDRDWAVGFCVEQTGASRDHEFEYRMVAADGRVVWLRDIVHVVRADDGRPLRLRGLMLDITRRRLSEQRLAAQHAASTLLSDAHDLDAVLVPLLEAIGMNLGWECGTFWRADPAGQTLAPAAVWNAPTMDRAATRQAFEGRSLALGEGLAGRAWDEGALQWTTDAAEDDEQDAPRARFAAEAGLRSALAFPVMTSEGVVGVFEFLVRERLAHEQDLEPMLTSLAAQIGLFVDRLRAEDAMRESHARRGAVLESSLDAIVTIDRWGDVREWNKAAEEIFGYSRAEALGRPMAELIVPENQRDAHWRGLARYLDSGEARILNKRLELRAVRRDGSTFPCELTIVRLPGEEPQFTGFLRDITDRHDAEEALERSERRYRTVAEAIPVQVWSARTDGRMDYVNTRATTYFGVSSADFVEEWQSFVHPDDLPRTLIRWARSLETGEPYEMEFRLRRHDGEWRWHITRALPLRDTHGAIVSWLGTNTDVHDQKEAHASLKESEHRYAQILDSVPDMVVCLDADGRALYANRASCAFHGVESGALRGEELRTEDDDNVLRVGQTLEIPEEERTDAAGHVRTFHTIKSPVLDTHGRVVQVVSVSRDITDRKHADERRRQLLLEIEQQRRRLDDIVASVPGVVWETWGEPGADGQRSDFVSDHVKRLLGYTREEWLAAPDFWLRIVHPDDRERAAQETRQHFQSGKGGTLQFRWRRKDGTYLWAQTWNTCVVDEQGRPIGMRGVTMDISPVKEAEKALRESDERFRSLIRATTQIVWTASAEGEAMGDSAGWRAFTGQTVEQWQGSGWLDAVHPDDRERTERVWREAVQRRTLYEVKYRLRRASGTYATVIARGVPVLNEDGSVREIVGMILDITEQEAAAEALRASHERTRSILESINDGFFALSHDWRFTYVNPQAEAILGRDASELLGRDVWELYPDAKGSRFEKEYRRAMEQHVTTQFEEYYQGLESWFDVKAYPGADGLSVFFRDVTERRRADAALRESEERYRFLADAVPDLVWTADPAGGLDYANRRATEYFGVDADALSGHGWAAHVHPEDVDAVAASWARAVETGHPYEAQLRLRRHDGKWRWHTARALPLRDADGAIVKWFGSISDIEDHKQAQATLEARATELERLTEELRYHTQLVKTITDNAGSALFMMDEKGFPIFMNPAACEMTGYAGIEEIRERELHYAVHFKRPDGSYYPMEECPIDQANAKIVPLKNQREIFTRKDGTLFPVEYNVAPVERNDKQLGAVLEVRDITEDLAREEALKDQARILATINRVTASLAGELDLDKLVQAVTDAGTEVTGAQFGAFFYNVEDEAGERYTLYSISGVPREAFSKFPMPRKTALFGPTFDGEGVVRIEDVTKDPRFGKNAPYHGMPKGHLPVCSYLAAPVVSRSGEVIGGLFFGHAEPGRFSEEAEQLIVGIASQAAIAVDNARLYREVQQRVDELARVAGALERSNAELDQFAYVTSHDLKAPLRGIANLSRWIEEDLGAKVDEETSRNLELLRGRVHRMEALIDAILEYSRVGRKRTQVAEVDVRDMLSEVRDLLAPPESYEIVIGDGMPTLVAERMRLQQVFMNLIGNAIKHGGPEGRVEITCEDAGENVRFTVKDDGPGIAPRYHQKVFTIFQTLEARDKVEGTGVGLALVKKIVESQGGEIQLDSDEGRGATFTFTWPKDPTGGDWNHD